MRTERPALLLLLLAVTAAVPVSARAAQPETDKLEARQHFARGIELANAGLFKDAIAELRRAYEIRPHFAVLYNIAEAYVALGDAASAVQTFRRYLAEGGADVPPERRAKVDAAIRAQSEHTGLIMIRVKPAGAEVRIDGVPVDAAALGAPVRVNLGARVVSATADDHTSAEQTVVVSSAMVVDVSLTLAPARSVAAAAAPPQPPPPPPPEHEESLLPLAPAAPAVAAVQTPSHSGLQRFAGYVTVSFGLATLAGASIFWGIAKTSWNSAIADGCTKLACGGQAGSERNRAQDALVATNVALVAGGALLVGGAVLVLTAPGQPSDHARVDRRAVALSLTLAPAGLAVGGAF
jgi:hypothetical protein